MKGVIEIRGASAADAEAIARLHGRSFLATYPELPKTVAATKQGLSRRTRLWTDRLASPPPGCATFVAAGDDGIYGFVFTGPSGDEDRTGHIFSIHVDPARWGSGLGKRLLSRALDFLSLSGYEEATLWVVTDNSRARTFYESLGWRLDGSERKENLAIEGMEGDEVTVVRYRLELNSAKRND
jgi:ribosomal protein S18 acetylase RimI-like enzyme